VGCFLVAVEAVLILTHSVECFEEVGLYLV
jgi:hypothetical protein